MDILFDYSLIISFLTLTSLEVILGIDNVIFISLLVQKLPKDQQKKVRMIGLSLALLMRIGLLFGIVWVMSLNEPFLSVFGYDFSGKDILMMIGGGFLIVKGTNSIHEEITHEKKEAIGAFSGTMMLAIIQIIFIDIIFSFDSVMAAIGLTNNISVIIAAMSIAMIAMLVSSGFIAEFIEKYPTLKILALAFIMLIGIFLVADGLHFHIPKGYIYFAMAFSMGVEVLNIISRNKRLSKLEKSK